MTAINEDRELHDSGPTIFVEGIQCGAHGTPGEQDVVNQDHYRSIKVDRNVGHGAGHHWTKADVVAKHGDVDAADRHGCGRIDLMNGPAEFVSDPHPAALQTNQHNARQSTVAFDYLVCNAGDRATNVVGAEHSGLYKENAALIRRHRQT